MKRAFTTREKVLLVILAVLLILVAYFKLLLEPINANVEELQEKTASEQDLILENTARLAKMNAMEKALQAIYDAGDARPLPDYDNAEKLLVELNGILSTAQDYSLNFGSASPIEGDYIIRRPISMTFRTANYQGARAIINALHDSDNINQISDVSMNFETDGLEVSLTIAYFELDH